MPLNTLVTDLGWAALAFLFLGLLFASGASAYSRATGSFARGGSVPFLFIPLIADWVRFLGHVHFQTSWLAALIIYLLATALWRLRVPRGLSWRTVLPWLLPLAFLLLANIAIRAWLFTGSAPNPADDVFAGYKASAVFNSTGWPTTCPEAPELAFSYYYYIFMWPAALGHWLNIPFWSGWWATAVWTCTIGCLLILEPLQARLKNKLLWLLTAAFAITGAAFTLPVIVLQRIPVKYWGGVMTSFTGDEFRFQIPQHYADYWGPFTLLAGGFLLNAVFLLIQLLRHRRFTPGRSGYVSLGLGALAGYCTFDLLGFGLVFVPVLLLILLTMTPVRHWLSSVWRLAVFGVSSVLLGLPFLLEIARRSSEGRITNLRHLPEWLQTHPPISQILFLSGVWIGLTVLRNPLAFVGLVSASTTLRPVWTRFLKGVFLWGCVVCFFGLITDFVPKFGSVVALTGALLFWERKRILPWQYVLLVLGLAEPALSALNMTRANMTVQKSDSVWRALDEQAYRQGLPVVYSIGDLRNTRGVWVNCMPFFSRSVFITPKEEFAETEVNFLRDAALRLSLKPVPERLATQFPQAREYILLGPPDSVPTGKASFHSDNFTLSLEEIGSAGDSPVRPIPQPQPTP